MKRPLNYAILKYFPTVQEASVDDVMDALREEYGDYKAFRKKDMIEAIMTAQSNGLLDESRFDLDEKGELRVYYTTTEEQRNTIHAYIK